MEPINYSNENSVGSPANTTLFAFKSNGSDKGEQKKIIYNAGAIKPQKVGPKLSRIRTAVPVEEHLHSRHPQKPGDQLQSLAQPSQLPTMREYNLEAGRLQPAQLLRQLL